MKTSERLCNKTMNELNIVKVFTLTNSSEFKDRNNFRKEKENNALWVMGTANYCSVSPLEILTQGQKNQLNENSTYRCMKSLNKYNSVRR